MLATLFELVKDPKSMRCRGAIEYLLVPYIMDYWVPSLKVWRPQLVELVQMSIYGKRSLTKG